MEELRLPDNIKVHFAGAEQYSFGWSVRNAGVCYGLWTCYNFLAPIIDQPFYPQIPRYEESFNIPQNIEKLFRHTIMDSGLFTLMFGSQSGKKDKAFIENWYQLLVNFVRENNIQSTLVEVDCQKVLGVEEAWNFRKKMRNDLPNNRQINVFHLEDGKEGLDRLIDFSDYIAISVPEWRIHRRGTYKRKIPALLSYIKSKKPKIDVHLLGCTEAGLLKSCRSATSSDSTSYNSCVKFGQILKKRRSSMKLGYAIDLKKRGEVLATEINKNTVKPLTKTMEEYLGLIEFSAKCHLEQYRTICGSQD